MKNILIEKLFELLCEVDIILFHQDLEISEVGEMSEQQHMEMDFIIVVVEIVFLWELDDVMGRE
jgi:hypothetical protein